MHPSFCSVAFVILESNSWTRFVIIHLFSLSMMVLFFGTEFYRNAPFFLQCCVRDFEVLKLNEISNSSTVYFISDALGEPNFREMHLWCPIPEQQIWVFGVECSVTSTELCSDYIFPEMKWPSPGSSKVFHLARSEQAADEQRTGCSDGTQTHGAPAVVPSIGSSATCVSHFATAQKCTHLSAVLRLWLWHPIAEQDLSWFIHLVHLWGDRIP